MDEINNYFTIFIGYFLYNETCKLYKCITKFINKLDFFNSSLHITKASDLKKINSNYIIATGEAEKLYTISGELFNSSIIELTKSSSYHEDFLLNPNGLFIQPYDKTHYSLKRLNLGTNILLRFISWLFPTQVLDNNDIITVYGKINTNPNDIMSDYSQYTLIKAKRICHNIDFETMKSIVQHSEVRKITLQISKVIMLGSLMFFMSRVTILPKLKRLYKLLRYRASIYCSVCNERPCNLLCEKCDYITNYCDICYLAFQEKINNAEVKLDDIKCGNCKATLQKVQKLLIENNSN
jgi:hypothetical protein